MLSTMPRHPGYPPFAPVSHQRMRVMTQVQFYWSFQAVSVGVLHPRRPAGLAGSPLGLPLSLPRSPLAPPQPLRQEWRLTFLQRNKLNCNLTVKVESTVRMSGHSGPGVRSSTEPFRASGTSPPLPRTRSTTTRPRRTGSSWRWFWTDCSCGYSQWPSLVRHDIKLRWLTVMGKVLHWIFISGNNF